MMDMLSSDPGFDQGRRPAERRGRRRLFCCGGDPLCWRSAGHSTGGIGPGAVDGSSRSDPCDSAAFELGPVSTPPMVVAEVLPAKAPSRTPRLGAGSVRAPSSNEMVAAAVIARHWPWFLLVIWACGATSVLAGFGSGVWRMSRLTRRARPVKDRRWLALANHAAARIGLRRSVRLLVSDAVEMPATAGLVRPVVVIPEHAGQWLTERREAVLLHELIHVARFDWPARIVARLALAPYWFNPLAWWAVRRLELEQELACDEEVLANGTRASSYANHLLGIARGAEAEPGPGGRRALGWPRKINWRNAS